jgi:S1-C subfamily serine protease
MIKGVATVIVDLGYAVQSGVGYRNQSLGSAFFVDASGLLITNYHVIASEVDPSYEGYSRMYIRLGASTNPRIRATVVGWDAALDLALIKADVTPEYVFSLADWALPAVGDTVTAIGSPAGLEQTVTSGIVSAQGRRLLQLGDVVQIDAALNPGNSGGPVVDSEGRLVGVAFAQAANFQGLNFAIPAEWLAAALPALLSGGRAARPWLGTSLAEGTKSGAEVQIIYTAPLTPAAEQRILEGSYMKSFNGVPVKDLTSRITALQKMLISGRPGELAALELQDGTTYLLQTITRPDLPLVKAAEADTRERLAAPFFGMILSPSGQSSGLFSSGAAYLVKEVARGSAADELGLQAGDPVSIRSFTIDQKEGYAVMSIAVKRRSRGFLEAYLQLAVLLDSSDTF